MQLTKQLAALWGTAAFLVVVAGCSSGANQAVSGTVTFKSKPLDQGTIQFLPKDPKKTKTQVTALIEKGAYNILAEKGLEPGEYKILISAGDPKAPKAEPAPGESGPPAKEMIPAKYNVNSAIYKEVTTAGPNKFDFTIP
ncbi:MAG: hypothetical protein IT429_09665 [Gemmataceae bacterium]|nr:hypothetical protein [Gemmataceae bacterium]